MMFSAAADVKRFVKPLQRAFHIPREFQRERLIADDFTSKKPHCLAKPAARLRKQSLLLRAHLVQEKGNPPSLPQRMSTRPTGATKASSHDYLTRLATRNSVPSPSWLKPRLP